ncbi:keratin, type I cytoskeletal 18 isoform X2 [Microcaecilia unicolor]|uniref:Keratin, type I cytoskeletal 18-like isoform X2 n=1 Tax=Microcaecilia unicolor TaxID=1415580 RepID=A0A6P7YNH4_9AMPH|nr:keratin, type I cytoskeletal 18-like isoform X2 [Microcaecilia unicolor]
MAQPLSFSSASSHRSSVSGSGRPWPLSASSMSGVSASLGSRLKMALPALRSSMDSLLQQNNHQEMMQALNERLAGYLQRVRGLEATNHRLEDEICEITARRGPCERDWDSYERPLVELRKQVEDLNMDNAKLLLQIDNARLAADDFRVKLEAEQAICDGVQKDTMGLRKMIEDTSHLRMKLDSELEVMKEEYAHLRKSHKEEVEALRDMIANNNVKVEVDAPKKRDLNDSVAEVRSQYEKMAEQNRADAENWYKDKFDNMTQEANVNTQALEQAKTEMTELRRQLQNLEIERQTLQKTVDSLENTLRETEDHYGNNLANLNRILNKLQEELAACRADIERQVRDYEVLLNLKTKLEDEINHYHRLLEGASEGTRQTDG